MRRRGAIDILVKATCRRQGPGVDMEKLRGWEELCRQHAVVRVEEDSACMAITARFAAFMRPTREEVERWHTACERTAEVEGRMRRYASAASLKGSASSEA